MYLFLLSLKKKIALNLSVIWVKVLIGDTIFTSLTGDMTTILRGHLSHAKIQLLAVQMEYFHFSVILRPSWVMVRPRESNPRPPALQSGALPTELILLWKSPLRDTYGHSKSAWSVLKRFHNILISPTFKFIINKLYMSVYMYISCFSIVFLFTMLLLFCSY